MSGHSNVLKPIGCCLHTPSPIFVYEFAANGVLAYRIHVSSVTERQHEPMVWERRLKIARQIAHALSYLHTAFPRPVIHMNIDMRSILLNEHDVPKLSGFYFSVSIPEGETDVEVHYRCLNPRVFAPEFNATGKVMEKTDVFDFGRFLFELLTGEDSQDGEGGPSLEQQLQTFLDLGLACTEEDPQRRPTMVDVTKQLRQIERFTQTGEELGGNLQNLKLLESFEEHASTSLKRNASSDEIQVVNEASERPLEV
ncbi:serine/threonine-protein kinase ZRK1-like [Quercus robur]|uniref:serine/threonine-protein kinase ZRK1-like n=1 Tax=Quercus robur TaxID=38942 RepID=UPI0021631F22|nr:serine/threonine-protein kinase ZRK1-like [Quercus robur]